MIKFNILVTGSSGQLATEIRAISRKHLVYRNGETDTSFSIQFVFKGLGEVGMPIENLLEEGILGYDVP